MEASKHTKASIAAFSLSVAGTVFMAGSVFSITANMVILCKFFAVPAFIGWIAPYFIYRKIERDRIAEVTPLLDQKFDELYSVCERASNLIDSRES